MKRSVAVDAAGIPLGAVAAPANRHDSPLLGPTLSALETLGVPESGRVSTSTAATTRRPPAGSWRTVAWWA